MSDPSILQADDDSDAKPGVLRRAGAVLLVLGILLALGLMVRSFLSGPDVHKSTVQQIAVLRQQPPPPPPKPPEKLPEPPKVKDEVKIDQPKDVPPPDQPKAADDKPVSDKPLGVDAEPGAGSDGFGLAANRGGRDLLSTGSGAGSSGAYYSGLLQRAFFDALTRNRRVLKDEFRVVVRVWFGDDGRVQKADIVNGSGNAQTDDLIQLTLLDMSPLKDVPPLSMRPIQVRLSNRS